MGSRALKQGHLEPVTSLFVLEWSSGSFKEIDKPWSWRPPGPFQIAMPGYRASVLYILKVCNVEPETDAKHSVSVKAATKKEKKASQWPGRFVARMAAI